MLVKTASSKEFEQGLQEFVGKKLTDFYYVTDSVVTLLAGKKFTNDRGTIDSEYELMISGGWEYIVDSKLLMTSIPQSKGENIPELRGKLEDFIDSLHPKTVTSIVISDDGKGATITLDNSGSFIVHGHEDSFVNYSHKVYEEDGKFVSATHLRPNEDTGELTLVQVP